MNKKEVYKIIRTWECDAGESFFEYYGDNHSGIDEKEIMEFMLNKGYIDQEKFDLYIKATQSTELGDYTDISKCMCGYDDMYSLFPYGECCEDAIFKAELVAAEFIAGNPEREADLENFAFKGKGWAYFSNEEQKANHEKSLRNAIANWDEEDDAEYERIEKLTIEDVQEIVKKEQGNED